MFKGVFAVFSVLLLVAAALANPEPEPGYLRGGFGGFGGGFGRGFGGFGGFRGGYGGYGGYGYGR